MSSAVSRTLPVSLLLVLALFSMTGPAATDLYLPAFPQMAQEFGVGAAGVQFTLTAFLLGMGVGQLFFGAVSDKYGRYWPLLVGMAAFVGSSLVAATAPTLEVLVAARLVQGLSAASGVVISRAIVADLVSGVAAVRTFSILATIASVAPAVAPLVGSLIAAGHGWRGTLWVLAGVAVAMLAGVLTTVRETLPVEQRRQGALAGGLVEAARQRRFMGYVLLFAAGFGVIMSIISSSPFVYQSMMGFSPQGYALMFGTNALGMITAGIVSARLASRIPPRRTISVAVAAIFALSLVALAIVLLGLPPLALAPCLFLLVASVGFVMGNTTGLAIAEVRHVAGSGSSWLGGAQFATGALVSALVGLAGEYSALPLALVLTGCSLAAICAVLLTAPRTADAPLPAESVSAEPLPAADATTPA